MKFPGLERVSQAKIKLVLNVVTLISREVQGDLTIPLWKILANINKPPKNKLVRGFIKNKNYGP